MASGSHPGGEDRVRKKTKASFFPACGRGENPVVLGMILAARDVAHFGKGYKMTCYKSGTLSGAPQQSHCQHSIHMH